MNTLATKRTWLGAAMLLVLGSLGASRPAVAADYQHFCVLKTCGCFGACKGGICCKIVVM